MFTQVTRLLHLWAALVRSRKWFPVLPLSQLSSRFYQFWGFFGGAVGKESTCHAGDSWVWKIPWRSDRLPTPVFLGSSGVSDSKESAHNAGYLGSIPGLGRSPGLGRCPWRRAWLFIIHFFFFFTDLNILVFLCRVTLYSVLLESNGFWFSYFS